MKKMRRFCLMLVCLLVFSLVGCGDKEQEAEQSVEGISIDELNSQDSFSVHTELLLELPKIDDNFRGLQGGCFTDQYAWFLVVSVEDYSNDIKKQCYVLQYDMETMTEIKRSEPIKLGHANDITYVEETNELYVALSLRNGIKILDADTLEIKETVIVDWPIYALDYEESREQFVGTYGTGGLVIFDKELNYVGNAPSQDTNLVTQGICADENYVYHVFYSPASNVEEPDNMIFVSDWEGNLIKKIPIGLKELEPENISLLGDVFYIGFSNGKGGVAYTAKLLKNE